MKHKNKFYLSNFDLINLIFIIFIWSNESIIQFFFFKVLIVFKINN